MEGPSVHAIAKKLQFLEGQEIEDAGGNAKQPKEKLKGKKIDDIRAVKKRLFIETEEFAAVVHFLMFGSYRINERKEDQKERLYLECTDDRLNLYNCSAKVLGKKQEEFEKYDRPESDVLSEKFDEKKALKKMLDDDRIIADVLLDQEVFGGVGNIIKNEVLYEEGIHPESKASEIPKEKSKEIIGEATGWAKDWLDRRMREDEKEFKIYQKCTCKECGSDIERSKTGEFDRITFACPRCQRKFL